MIIIRINLQNKVSFFSKPPYLEFETADETLFPYMWVLPHWDLVKAATDCDALDELDDDDFQFSREVSRIGDRAGGFGRSDDSAVSTTRGGIDEVAGSTMAGAVGKVGFLKTISTLQVLSSSSGKNCRPWNGVEEARAISAKASILKLKKRFFGKFHPFLCELEPRHYIWLGCILQLSLLVT